jgi:hypothetical protein
MNHVGSGKEQDSAAVVPGDLEDRATGADHTAAWIRCDSYG